MAEIDNGHGEMMPDEVQVLVDNPPILYATSMPMQQTDAAGHNTAQPRPPVFVYLDVGRWGGDLPGGQRCFGLVWGRWTALCEFLPGAGPKVVINDGTSPLDSILDTLNDPNHHVLLRKKLWSPTAIQEPDPNTVWVVIGDLHLPVRTAATRPPLILKPKPWDWRFGLGPRGRTTIFSNVASPENRNGRQFFPEDSDSVTDWYANYAASDIFQSAGGDLVTFLQLIEQLELDGGRTINILQIGDMYELWNGMDRYWVDLSSGGEGVTPLPNRDADGMAARDFVRFWVLETNRAFPSLIQMLNGTDGHPRFFLHGNHDCYLKDGALSPPVPTVIPRRTLVHKGGVFIEHGQSPDDFNRDGATRGYLITQANFLAKNGLRNLEDPARRIIGSDKRKVFVNRPASLFAGTTDFAVYVMGHTHSPFLTLVRLVQTPPQGVPGT
jgi:hypothetical protein